MGQNGTFDKRRVIPVIIILVVLLVLATTLAIFYAFETAFGGRQLFPGLVVRNVQAGCSTLTWTPVSTTATNRTLLFQCPGSGMDSYALRTNPSDVGNFGSKCYPCYPVYGTTPSFTLPQGYLALSLTAGGCPSPSTSPSLSFIPLKTGQEIVVGWDTYLYDYCAVVDNSVSHPTGFTIDWTPGTPPITRPAPFMLSSSPTQTVSYGANATYTITATSLNRWAGNVTVSLRGGYTIEIPAQFTPGSLIIKSGESDTTTMIQPTYYPGYNYYATRGRHTLMIDGDAPCVNMVMGVCLEGYREVTISIEIDIV